MTPAKLIADIRAAAARLQLVPRQVAAQASDRLTAQMAARAVAMHRKHYGWAEPVAAGLRIMAYRKQPYASRGWLNLIGAIAKKALAKAAKG